MLQIHLFLSKINLFLDVVVEIQEGVLSRRLVVREHLCLVMSTIQGPPHAHDGADGHFDLDRSIVSDVGALPGGDGGEKSFVC